MTKIVMHKGERVTDSTGQGYEALVDCYQGRRLKRGQLKAIGGAPEPFSEERPPKWFGEFLHCPGAWREAGFLK